MAATSNLHILRIDVEIANFSKVLAKSAVEWPITRGIISTVFAWR
jgi:hypothetical protein